MVSDSSIFDLAEGGFFKDAAAALDSKNSLTNSQKILRARLEMDVGSSEAARAQTQTLLALRLNEAEICSCLEIIGRTHLATGNIDEGLRAFDKASQAATRTGDPKIAGRLIANFCDALLHWIGIEETVAQLPKLRQAAVSAGDSYCLIAFHLLVGELKAKKGHIRSAKRSIETAESLLDQWRNVWLLGRLWNTKSAIHLLEADYPRAANTLNQSLAYATMCGSRRLRITALANFAHTKIAQGSLDDAKSAVNELLGKVLRGGNNEIATLDTQLEIALAEDDIEKALRLARESEKKSLELEGGRSYHGLWNASTRTRVLFRAQRIQDGMDLVTTTIPHVSRFADQNLLTKLKLLAAEGFARLGNTHRAADLIHESTPQSENLHLEVSAERQRIIALLAARENQSLARQHFTNALSILQEVGNITAMQAVLRDAIDALDNTVPLPNVSSEGSLEIQTAPKNFGGEMGNVIQQLIGLVDLAAVPPAMARECVSTILEAGAASEVAIHRRSPDGNESSSIWQLNNNAPATATKVVEMNLGAYRGVDYRITAQDSGTASARLTLLAIDRLVRHALLSARIQGAEDDSEESWREPIKQDQLGLICCSDRMQEVIRTAHRVASSTLPVLLSGETGVGKEVIARNLHRFSPRSDLNFLPFNVTTVPRDMLDTQLFGHKRGSFTGALDDAPGVIKAAAGGTLFLDEIGEMSLEAQPKLLRFLESGEILPLGKHKPETVDVRIVAATNANLEQLMQEGKFREDLYYRLNVIRIEIPPLRERREEIPLLVDHFLDRFSRELQKPVPRVADETLEYLVLYRWPGNVRQLSNEIRRMVALAEPGAVLMPAHLSPEIAASRRTIPAEALAAGSNEVVTRIDQSLSAAIEHVERASIQRALAVCDNRVEDAAKLLGLSRKGLYLKRQRLKIEDADLRRTS